jgi:ABC-type nitrate/sulfonate/bicarbonate transport system permease component
MHVDILVTLKRTLIALSIGVSLGFTLALILSYFKNISIIEITISALMTIPGMALAPISILLFGFGDTSIIFVGLIAAMFPILYNTISGLKIIPQDIIEASQLAGCNYFQSLFYIQIPVASSSIFTGLELSLAKAWRTVIAVEFVASTRYGLGYAIWDATEYLRFDTVILGIVMIILIHFILNRIIKIVTNPFVFKSN